MRPAPRKIAVMGAGSWGTTFAKVLADSGAGGRHRSHDLGPPQRGGGRDQHASHQLPLPARNSAARQHHLVLRPLQRYLAGAELVVLAVPAQSLREQLRSFKQFLEPNAVLMSLMKGLEREHRCPDERSDLCRGRILPRTGSPSFPVPTWPWKSPAGNPPPPWWPARTWKPPPGSLRLCSTDYFRPYTNTDVIGVEIGGIVKNVIALAVGICDGMGMGDNTKSSIITRGLAETTRLALALGGNYETLSGLAGLGDLVATCSSSLSRNNTAGRLLGQGLYLDEVNDRMSQTAEGIKSGRAVLDLATLHNVEVPITEAVVMVLEGTLSVENMGARLLGRQLKSEGELK